MKKSNWLNRWDQVRIERGYALEKFRFNAIMCIETSFKKLKYIKGLWKRSSRLAWLGVIDSGGANVSK